MVNQKEFRRIVGFVAVWLQRLELDQVLDPRQARGKRWQLKQVLSACLLTLIASTEATVAGLRQRRSLKVAIAA